MAFHSTSDRYKYIYGSSVRKLDDSESYGSVPRKKEEPERRRSPGRRAAAGQIVRERPSNPEKEAAIEKNKARLKEFDWKYTVIAGVAVAICMAAALVFVRGSVYLNSLSAQLTDLKSQKEQLLSEQNALQTEIDKNINLDEIRVYAEEELHMVYPGPDRVIYYNDSTDDYFRQYESVSAGN